MKRTVLTALMVIGAAMLVATPAMAQPVNDTLQVTAQNIGIFTFAITETSFNFGQVDANGTTSSTGVLGTLDASGDFATYTQSGAANWTCASAPSRTVTLFLDSSSTFSTTAANATEDQLEVQVADAGGVGSLGFIPATAQDSAAGGTGDLITGMTVGNGNNDVDGTIDLQLRVDAVDGVGTMTWDLVITADAP